MTDEDRKQFIDDYWARMPKKVLDEYSRIDGTAYNAEVDEETYAKVRESKNGTRHYDSHPGSGGTDGWIRRKPDSP